MSKFIICFLFTVLTYGLGIAQTAKTKIPFELFGEHIFIKLQVNDSEPLDFIFDTGDGLTVLDINKARDLNILSDAKVTKTSAGGTVTGALLKHQKITVGGQDISDVELYETSLDHLEISIGRSIDGIIGYDVLKNFAVRIDYNAMEFSLYDKDNFKYTGSGDRFDLDLHNYIPYIPGTVTLANGETLKGDFFVDTGAGTTIDFNTPFVDKHKMISKIGNQYSYLVSGISDNETMHYKGKAALFKFGSFVFNGIPIGLSQAEHGIQASKKVDGILGNELLKRFNMVLDYEGGKIYMERNDVFDDVFRIDAAGFDLQYGAGMEDVFIHVIHENSPAAAEGIDVNAQLIEVAGKAVSSYSLPELKNLFSNANDQSIAIKILQNGEYLDIELPLKNLL